MIFVDAHVHIHPNFNLSVFLDSTSDNFRKAAVQNNCEDNYDSVICLTESYGINKFEELCNQNNIGGWKFLKTDEENSLKAVKEGKHSFFIIAGKQIATSEKLEVLALGVLDSMNDGEPIKEVIKFTFNRNGLPIVPWGTGKWLGNRGKIIKDLINYDSDSKLLLGDNGNRPKFWKKSSIFSLAQKNGIKDLPGSDPLPFIPEQKKSGSFGFIINGDLDNQYPFKDFKKKVVESETSFETFGSSENLFSFFKNQIAMQLIKRNLSAHERRN